jgi:oligoendopeptidase F
MAVAAESFVPADFNPSDFSAIEPLGRDLLQRPVESPAQVERWLTDLSRLFEWLHEHGSRLNVDYACHTDDPAREEAYLKFVREIEPKLAPLFFELQKRYLAMADRRRASGPGLAVMEREWQADVDVFRPENVPLDTRMTELVSQYGKIMGAMSVEFQGQSRTLQQMARFLEDTDRAVREQAWRLVSQRRLDDRAALDDLFQQLMDLRGRVAANAALPDYRAYLWKSRKRFDYTPEDCLAFGQSIQRVCCPLVQKLDRQRRDTLMLGQLRPWDTAVDIHGRPPLRPFDDQDIDAFVAGTREIFRRVDPALADQFQSLKDQGDLDLASRKGKRPGGFQASMERRRRPFIFMNAAGMQGDVDTMLHEAGHAFHYLAARSIDNLFVRNAPLEFCEVASMSMELLGQDHYDVFYRSPGDALRARRHHLEGIIRFLPWMAIIDGFQHWLYTHPGHSASQRTEHWLALLDRLASPIVDWSGLEPARQAMWHRQGHLFNAPFYYIEYGIAQLGALQVWLNYRKNPRQALKQLLSAFALGGTVGLPELFAAAGARFDFTESTLAPLIAAVEAELAALPE